MSLFKITKLSLFGNIYFSFIKINFIIASKLLNTSNKQFQNFWKDKTPFRLYYGKFNLPDTYNIYLQVLFIPKKKKKKNV